MSANLQKTTSFARSCIEGRRKDAYEIKDLLYDEMGEVGVLSFASNWNNPLMWSHYSDQHKGLCIEYDMTDSETLKPGKVQYDQPRNIRISDLISWKFDGYQNANNRIKNAFFYSKAPDGKYEQEWRIAFDSSGEQMHAIRISAIYFGMRCDRGSRMIFSNALFKNHPSIKWYDVMPTEEGFDLNRAEFCPDCFPTESVENNPQRIFRNVPATNSRDPD